MTSPLLKTAIALLIGAMMLSAGCENQVRSCNIPTQTIPVSKTETGVDSAYCLLIRQTLGVDLLAIEKRFNGATATAIPAQGLTDDEHADLMPPTITIGAVKKCRLLYRDKGEEDNCDIDQAYAVHFTAFSETDEEAIYGPNEWNTGQELTLQLHWKDAAGSLYQLPCFLKVDDFVEDNSIVDIKCSWPKYASTEWIYYPYLWHTPK